MSFPETVVAPVGRLNQASRLVGLLDRSEGRIRRRYLRLVRGAGQLESLETIANLLEAGLIDQALLALTDDLAPALSSSLDQVYAAAGLSAAEALRGQVDTLFDFNLANQRAVTDLQSTRLRLVREFGREQRLATQVFLEEAFARGAAPINQARALKRSIGLTEHQARAVVNFRKLLEERDPAALTRALRDRRFDPSINRAISTRTPLTTTQINRQVERYRERSIARRAQTIAETESLRAASAADAALWDDAVLNGVVDEADIENTWRTSKRKNRRDWHKSMEGQKRPHGVPFESGKGNLLRYPGDPNAPGEDTINCKCVVVRAVKGAAVGGARSAAA